MKVSLTKVNMLIMAVVFVFFVLLVAGFVYAKDSDIETVTAKINYYYYDENAEGYKGTRPYQAFVAHMPKDSADIEETCPVVPGFKPYIYDKESDLYVLTERVTVHFNTDTEIDVFYKPTEVVYKIRLMQQILNSDEYAADILIVGSGLTGSVPKEFEKDENGQNYVFPDDYTIEALRGKTLETAYDGFTFMYHQPDVIAADGSTEFECYYDRNYYHVNFDLGENGYGVEPLYLPYDYPLTMDYVGIPKRAGFQFIGWAEKLDTWSADYEPVEGDKIDQFSNVKKDITYTAIWKPIQEVTYTIVYRNKALIEEGGNYDFWGKKELKALPGTVITIDDDFIDQYDNDDLKLTDYQYFTIDKEKTKSDNGTNQKVTIKGDGSTIITLYYSRNVYKIWYVYARHDQQQDSGDKKLVPANVIDSGHEYVIASMNHEKAVTSKPLTESGSEYLKQDSWDEDTEYKWTFEFDLEHTNPDVNGDYHVYVKNSEGKYLLIRTPGNNKRAEMVDESQKTLFTLKRYYDTKKENYYWSLQQGSDSDNNYLNDKGNAGTRIQGYEKIETETAWQWHLYDMTEKQYDQSANKPQNIRVPTGTGNGRDDGEDDGKSGGVKWNIKITDLPQIDDSLTTGNYTRTFTDSNGNAKTYVYRYIEIEAEYNADIENIWPMNKSSNEEGGGKLIHDCQNTSGLTYSFGSWAMNYYTPIRAGSKNFGNIVGPYPTMSSGLIIDKEASEEKYNVKLPYVIRNNEDGNVEILDEAAYAKAYPEGLPEGKEEVTDLAQIMYPWWTTEAISNHAYEIYYEPLPGEDLSDKITDKYFGDEGDIYELNRTEIFTCAHNGTTRLQPYAYKGFESVLYLYKGNNWVLAGETEGIDNSMDTKYSHANTVPKFVADATNKTVESMWVTKLHYKRKRSNLSFYGYTPPEDDSKTYTDIPYGMILTKESNMPPDPAYFDADAAQYYEFGGWYLSELHEDSEKVDWGSFTMPDHDLELYAYWKPKNYTVNFYADETKLGSDVFKGYESYYGENIEEEVAKIENSLAEVAPTYILSDGYEERMTQVGWYYYDVYGNIHAFDPKTMTVSGDIDLFMRWSTTVPTEYTVHYMSEVDGHTVRIASDTTGYSFVGLTKTFKAKVENQLYDGYTEGFFPYTSSTSILMKTPNSLNEKTFRYANVGEVNYRIRYVLVGEDGKVNYDDKGNITNQEIADPEVHSTKIAAVTPQYKPVEGYVPMDYYITHIVTVPELDSTEYETQLSQYPDKVWPQNEIIFRYKADTYNMPYHVKYLLEDENGSYEQKITKSGNTGTYHFRQINYIDNIGPKDSGKTAPLNHYTGYEVAGYITKIHGKAVAGDKEEITTTEFQVLADSNTAVNFRLDSKDNSIEVYIYYLRKEYPVKVTYSIVSENDNVKKQWYETLKESSVFKQLTPDTETEMIVDGDTIYTTLYKIVENQKYDTIYEEQDIPSFSKYRLSEDSAKMVVVSHDDGTFVRNKISLIWMEIDYIMYYYHAVLPDKENTQIAYSDDSAFSSMKLININQENVEIYQRPVRAVTAKESTDLYRFKNWYKGNYDADTKEYELTEKVTAPPATLSEDGRTLRAPGGANTDQYYFAVYDYIRGDLCISTDGCDNNDMTQSFEYLITGTDVHNNWVSLKIIITGNGTQTIKDLPIGNYTVSQTGWSWRYTPSTVNVKVEENVTANARFTQSMKNKKWLDGNDFKDNDFKDNDFK